MALSVRISDSSTSAHAQAKSATIDVARVIAASARWNSRVLSAFGAIASLAAPGLVPRSNAQVSVPIVRRADVNPIIRPEMLRGRDGENINGPSLIRTPSWLPRTLGRYYLYFAHHGGQYIRLAYADSVKGPYSVYEAGTLRLEQMPWCDYMVASPDVHVDDARHEIRMYFHCHERSSDNMVTFVARSTDGRHFVAQREPVAPGFVRVFRWRGDYYALAMPGVLYRSKDGLTRFTKGPTLFGSNMRHSTVAQTGANDLWVLYSNVGDAPPEHILMTRIRLVGDWMDWQPQPPQSLLKPETKYEGVNLPLRTSVRGAGTNVRELRDPALYHEDKWYLLYSVAGESGIAIAELVDWRP